MRARRPHYFLRTQAAAPPESPRWAFSLQGAAKLENDHQSPPITASDIEPNASWERLQLLAVVRGLEALPEPALVTLATASDVVRRGIRHGLEEWREFDWQLEHFGELIPVKNADLWRRIDRALAIHDVQIRNVRVDEPIVAEQSEQPHFVQESTKSRRGQTALAASGKTRCAADAITTDGLSDTISAWSSDLPRRDQSRGSGADWHEGNTFDDHDAEAYDTEDFTAQKSGTAAFGRTALHKAGANQKPESRENRRLSHNSFRPFSLLRCKRILRASRLHVMRRIGELWDSWLWFYEVTGLEKVTQTRKPRPLPWLRDRQQRE